MLVFSLRVLFFILAVLIAYQTGGAPGSADAQMNASVAGLAAMLIITLEALFKKRFHNDFAAVTFGLVVGIVITFFAALILGLVVAPFVRDYKQIIQVLFNCLPILSLFILYITTSFVVQTRNDFRFVIPYIDFSDQSTTEGGLVLDTSAIIDGRIADVAKTGMITVPLIIPTFVVRELQGIAKGSDKAYRARGRRGLDIIKTLQANKASRVILREDDYHDIESVDTKVIKLTKDLNARIISTDYNLNKGAQIEGVTVINLNDLSNSLKPIVIPGECLKIKIIKEGEDSHQGVGYLDDGTMVVVDNASAYIGDTVSVSVTSTLQTSAGRMIFGSREAEVKSDGTS